MVDQHIGYPGSVNAAALADWMPNVAGAQYSVEGPNDAKVVTNNVGDRGVTVKAGKVIGDGIMDVFETDTNLNFSSVSPGSPDRWDMIVLRRTWNATAGASTSLYTIIPGGPNRSLPARNMNRGVLADQPIALCRIKTGVTAVQEIVDLRAWAHNGGVWALDEMVKNYLDQPGTHLTIGGISWVRLVTSSATSNDVNWVKLGGLSSIGLFGGSVGALDGPPGSNPQNLIDGFTQFFVQAGTNVNYSDQSGFARLTFQRPFPNGLLTVMAGNGDDWATGGSMMFASAGNPGGGGGWFGQSGYGAKHDWVYSVLAQPASANGQGTLQFGRQPNKIHRLNWIAIGW